MSLDEVGLGYVRLGQSATTLSGGEAQRVKLASHLATARSITNRPGGNEAAAKARSRTLYILDEPTTGLHFDDVAKLLAAFRKLIDGGGSLLVIEHNLDVIKSADWVIDMGPEGGSGGGQVVAVGTPEEIAANPASHTGHWLAPVLNLPSLSRTKPSSRFSNATPSFSTTGRQAHDHVMPDLQNSPKFVPSLSAISDKLAHRRSNGETRWPPLPLSNPAPKLKYSTRKTS